VRSEEKGEDDKSRSSLMEVQRLNGAVFLETMPLTRSSKKLFGFYTIGFREDKRVENLFFHKKKKKKLKTKFLILYYSSFI